MRPGDILWVDFGIPVGSAVGFRHPAVVVASPDWLIPGLATVTVVPCTTTVRSWAAEVPIEGYGVAQPWLIAAPSRAQIAAEEGVNVGVVTLTQIREVLADVLGMDW